MNFVEIEGDSLGAYSKNMKVKLEIIEINPFDSSFTI